MRTLKIRHDVRTRPRISSTLSSPIPGPILKSWTEITCQTCPPRTPHLVGHRATQSPLLPSFHTVLSHNAQLGIALPFRITSEKKISLTSSMVSSAQQSKDEEWGWYSWKKPMQEDARRKTWMVLEGGGGFLFISSRPIHNSRPDRYDHLHVTSHHTTRNMTCM